MPPPHIRSRHPRFDLIVSDIDGCLQPESSTPMDLASLARVAEWNAKSAAEGELPLVTLCSGRPQPFAEAMCKLLGNVHAPCVAENGVWVYDPRGNEYIMDPAITSAQLEMVHEASAWLRQEYGPLGVTQQPGKVASISLYHPRTEVLKEIQPVIAERFEAKNWPLRVSMTWLYINCDLTHISKATGMKRLMELAGVKAERLAGIGDTMSDLAIRENVAWFACPANAAEEIKRRADFVAGESEARGVVEILRQIHPGSV